MSEKRFEMVTVEDPLWEYGTHLKDVLQDNQTGKQYRAVSRLVDLLNELSDENRQLKEENEQLRRYVYHCPQICNIILAYLRKCEREDVKAVNDAMNDDKYFDEEVDTLRSWE